MSDYEPSLETFSNSVDKLASGYPSEFDRYRVDEVIVAAIAPTVSELADTWTESYILPQFRRAMATWKPLEEPNAHVDMLRKWRRALKMTHAEPVNDMQVDSLGSKAAPKLLSV